MGAKEKIKSLWLIFVLLFVCCCQKPLKLEEVLVSRDQKTEGITLSDVSQESYVREERSRLPSEPAPLELPSYKKKAETKAPVLPLEKKEEERLPINYKALVGVKQPVVLNVENMPLNDFIVYALGELLKVPFLVDEAVMKNTSPVTLRLPRALEPEEVLEAVVSFLEGKGFEVSQKGKVLSIVSPKPKPAPPSPIGREMIVGGEVTDTSQPIVYFYPVKYLRAHELEFSLQPFIRHLSVEVKSFPRENALYFVGPGYSIKSVLEIVELLDVPFFAGKKMFTYGVTYWKADELSKELANILSGLGYPVAKNFKEPGIFILPIASLNLILLGFPDDASFSFVMDWIKRLDSPELAGKEKKVYTYKPRYSKAKDLVDTLGKVLASRTGVSSPQVTAQPSPQTGSQPTSASRAPSLETGSFLTQELALYADEVRNLVVICGTPQAYNYVLQILRELDTPPRQILIEATILELTLKDELKFGLEWYITNRHTKGNYTLGQIFGIPTKPGLSFTWVTDTANFNLLLNAFAAKGLTNILSTPKLMVLDNHVATIQVGTDVPIITGEVTTAQAVAGAQAGVVRSIQYRNTGVILNVKPTIYTEDTLRLEITQEVSEMGASPPGIGSPTILVRKINTTVIAKDGQTIVLGGLISDTKGTEENKLPFIGDIPLLGHLFKSYAKENRKTELIVLLRPHIVKNFEEASAITKELREKFRWLR